MTNQPPPDAPWAPFGTTPQAVPHQQAYTHQPQPAPAPQQDDDVIEGVIIEDETYTNTNQYAPYGTDDPTDLTRPMYGASFVPAIARFFRSYARFTGRASTGEFWWPFLGLCAVQLTLMMSSFTAQELAPPMQQSPVATILAAAAWLVWLLTVLPLTAAAARRLHDTNMSAAFLLVGLIPFIGPLAVTVLLTRRANPAGSRFDRPGR